MSRELRQSTAQTERIGPFLDATDGVTEEVSLGSPPTEISKDGAAFATGPVGTHDAEGWYSVPFTTAHTNTLGSLVLKSHDAATHLPVWHEFMVIPADVYDSLVLGTDTLPADVTQILGDGTSATDLKDFADAGYDPVTNKVQGVVLVDSLAADSVNASALATDAVNEIADGLLDRANGIETGLTLRQSQRIIASATAGKVSGADTTTMLFRNAVVDSKNRLTVTVDLPGNRSAITYDLA